MQISQRKAGIILSYVTIVINVVVAFVYVPVFLHYMGQSEFGLYNLMGSLIAYFSILDFGLPATIVRYYSKYKALNDEQSMENILALCFRIYLVITVVLVTAGIVLYFFLDSFFGNSLMPAELVSAKKIYIVFLINVSITVPVQIFNAVLMSYERFAFLKLLTLGQVVLQPFVIIAMLRMYPTALSLVSVQTLFNLLAAIWRVYYCFAKLKIKIKMHYFDKELFFGLLRFSFFICLNVIADQILWRSNQLILGVVATTAVVAIYAIAFQISYNYSTLSTVVSGVFLPRVTEMVTQDASRRQLSDLFITVGRLQFLLLSCVMTGFIVFGRPFIALWAGAGFEQAYLMTLLLIIPFTVEFIQNLGFTILQAQNKFAFKVKLFLAIALINIVLAVPAAKRFGGVGCAAVTGITFFIGNVIMNVYYSGAIGLDIKRFWLEILKMAIPSALCCVFGFSLNAFSLPSKIVDLGLKIIIYLAVYVLAMWLFAMNDYEKNLVRGPVSKSALAAKKIFLRSK